MRRTTVFFIVLGVVSLWAWAQQGGFFQNYPGGASKSVYKITQEKSDYPILLTMEIQPVSADTFTVRTTNEVTGTRTDLERGVLEGLARAQLEVNSESLTALRKFLADIQPNTVYVLPNGARFEAGARDKIAGVDVIRGVLTDPKKPNQRTLVALTLHKAVPFPPLLQIDERRGLVFVTVFTLELLEFSMRP
ncbi:hypothetical protein HRbin07_00050 [bacterium HR07]|uniref:Uncharacterized protein n=2 Tax=Candidatus Bipolaricaulota TaxID=67810 RepID=H5S8A5_9BACT|nr:hypothetical protein HGMM_F01C04C11 [uncultured Acetothermia bacterium]BAL60066.1 hypothetical protein HGMM_OP4C702 [Candidatus Acetothermum autotrophicum]GBC75858.1 hypothetical protein HRbin07_00050 [bacterium HR07]